jgi:hypothetical protein
MTELPNIKTYGDVEFLTGRLREIAGLLEEISAGHDPAELLPPEAVEAMLRFVPPPPRPSDFHCFVFDRPR